MLAWATGAAASNCCSWPSGSNDVQELQSLLSPHAKIILPSESSFADATSRWSALDAPEPNVVVLVATEKDVAATVNTPQAAVNDGELSASPLNQALNQSIFRCNSQTRRNCPSWRMPALTALSPRWAR